MNSLNDPEEKIFCPYNKSHHIRRSRMNGHLVKCKQSYPDVNLVECDFNVNHRIPEPELQYHHEHCPDRKTVEIKLYQEEGIDLNKYPINNTRVEADDNWDELDVPSYDPIKYCENNALLRKVDVVSAAPRKNFRINQRHRVSELDSKIPRAQESFNKINATVEGTHPSTSRRELPDKPRAPTLEETPESVAKLMGRLKVKCYIPKQPSEQSN